MSKYKLTFKLKQHTPIIHFQHDQHGATLRATEVKPKLDRFLREELKEYCPALYQENKNLIKSLPTASEKKNSPYKLSVVSNGALEKYVIASYIKGRVIEQYRSNGFKVISPAPYFADNKPIGQGSIELEKFGIKVEEEGSVELRFQFFEPRWKLLLEKVVPAFLCTTNFGSRQSKGFGCFLPYGITDTEIIDHCKKIPSIQGIFRKDNSNDFSRKLQTIAKEYAILKRGDSYNTYIKSKLWEFLCSNKNINWEKKAIKMHLKTNNPGLFEKLKYNHRKPVHAQGHFIDTCNSDSNDFYIRALLGLAEQFEFVKQGAGRLKVKIDDRLKFEEDHTLKALAVERFASPIRYLITENSIFIITTAIPKELLYYLDNGQERRRVFHFKIDEMIANNSFDLKIPEGFSLEQFVTDKAGYGSNLKNN